MQKYLSYYIDAAADSIISYAGKERKERAAMDVLDLVSLDLFRGTQKIRKYRMEEQEILKTIDESALSLGTLFDAFNEDYKFDMIISNPPYIKTEDIWRLDSDVKDYEPMLALDGMEDGLYFYREIIGEAPKYLKKDGCLVLEIGFDQADDVGMLLEKTGFKDITIKQDLSGLDRVAHGWI